MSETKHNLLPHERADFTLVSTFYFSEISISRIFNKHRNCRKKARTITFPYFCIHSFISIKLLLENVISDDTYKSPDEIHHRGDMASAFMGDGMNHWVGKLHAVITAVNCY